MSSAAVIGVEGVVVGVLLALVGLAIVVAAVAIAIGVMRAMRLPERAPAFVGPRPPGKRRVAFLGASLTHGKVSADWTALVGAELDVDVVNAGVNGDTAWNALQRLPAVLATDPDTVVVLVGTNDVMGGLDAKRGARYRAQKKLPQSPTREWYGENLVKIRDAVVAAGKKLVFATLPPLGERLGDDVNDRVRAYNDVIRATAAAAAGSGSSGHPVVDVYAAFVDELQRVRAGASSAGPRDVRGFEGSEMMMVRAIVRRHVRGWSFERISRANGFVLLTDGIHANERGARLIADAMLAALRA